MSVSLAQLKKKFTAYVSHDALNRNIPRNGDPEFCLASRIGSWNGRRNQSSAQQIRGRALAYDVIDTFLHANFGNTVPALGLAPEDRHESPCLETDNVGFGAHQFHGYFPYRGDPT